MRRAALVTLCGLALAGPADALAAGGPVLAVLGGAGASVTGSPFNFVALGAGRGTLVERLRRDSGTVEGSNLLRGSFGVPGAANDGSTTGLSADGRTLVLAAITNTYPPTRTGLVVLNTSDLVARARIALRGFFTVDAISPTGRWLYLIHYRSANLSDYEVRAYDLASRQLLAKPVVDPRQPDEKMQGVPITRTTSAGGRWVYTLYQRVSGTPFIHALDTTARSAFCVDLPALARADLSSARLALASGTTLRIENQGTPLALMNTRTFAVRSIDAVQSPPSHRPAPRGHDATFPWALGVALFAGTIALVLLARRRRRPLITRPPIADTR